MQYSRRAENDASGRGFRRFQWLPTCSASGDGSIHAALALHTQGGINVGRGTSSPVRWGIIGLGWVATDFIAPAMVKNANSQLAACLGSSVEKGQAFAERFGVERVHRDLEALMHAPDVDSVYIALPNALHHQTVLLAARGKKHILCEKPFAMSVASAAPAAPRGRRHVACQPSSPAPCGVGAG